jgi:DNA-binding CsgD family transcriptional regulator
VFLVLAINDVVAPISLGQLANLTVNQKEEYYFYGIIIGTIVVLLMQRWLLVNICNMLNLSFALLAIGFVVEIISFQAGEVAPAAAVCFGISYAIGIINIYYLAGFMTKKFQSILFYRVGIILATLYYFVTFTVLDVFKKNEMLSPVFMALVCVCTVVLFFLLTPFFVKMLYTGEWIEDSYREDVTRCSRLEAKLRDYKLTSAEIEVCRLLLEGCTLRQISGIQSKAYATVNTYCTSIYRKLHINSRTELLILLKKYTDK